MNLLIKSALIVDPNSPYKGKRMDILIEKGQITEMKAAIKTEKGYKRIEAENLCVSPGWVDMQANFRDPGFEYKEDLASGCNAAAQGGFTTVCVMPGTNPPVHSKTQVDYILNKTRHHLVEVLPVGCISDNHEGRELAEMYDMKQSGAVAFSDDKKPIKDAGLLMRALQYSAGIGTFIITHCDDKTISHGGKMHEGETSTRIGLKGIPALAEEIMVQRNLAILEYTGGKIHFPTISTRGSIELIKQAKSKGLSVSAGVAAHNLLLDDTCLSEFDTLYKVNPPLRTKEDVEALKKGIASGVIDVVVSDHAPEDTENKDIEFDYAADGIVAAETAYAVANSALYKLAPDTLVEKLAINPRRILGLKPVILKEGHEANLTIFSPSQKWRVEKRHIQSKSLNTPFIGQELTGKVIGVVNNKQVYIAV